MRRQHLSFKHPVIFIIILSGQALFGQTEIYTNAYKVAMADSVLSQDELNILKAIQNTLGLEEDEVLELQRATLETTASSSGFSKAGRRQIIAASMSLGNGLYGWGIPYIMDVETPAVYAGMQLLSLAGGFYLSWMATRGIDLPVGRAQMQISGGAMGMLSAYPLIAGIGFERYFEDIDPRGKKTLTYLMVAAPAGALLGDRIYKKYAPSDGLVGVSIMMGALGAANGMLAHLLVTDLDGDNINSWLRVNSLLTYGSTLGGAYMGLNIFGDEQLTRGDALLMTFASMLGALSTLQLAGTLETKKNPTILLMMLGVNGGAWIGHKMIEGVDYTSGEVRIISFGALAGDAVVRGLYLATNAKQNSKLASYLEIVSRIAGGYFTARMIDARPESRLSYREKSFKMELHPTLLPTANGLTPGLSVGITF